MTSINVVVAFSGGSGTSGDPYQITTAAELQSLNSYLGSGNSSKYFKLMNDIDLSSYNTGSGWTPIGNGSGSSYYFYGKFDGNYKTISNLYINASPGSFSGLFGKSYGTIQNVYLKDVSVTAGTSSYGVGSLIGENYGTVTNCGVNGGTVQGGGRTGGLIGSDEGPLSYLFANVAVTFTPPTSSSSCCAGGLTGEVAFGGSSASIRDSYSRSTVYIVYSMYNQGSVGGVLGNDYSSGSKYNLYSTGSITSNGSFPSNTGGLSGGNYTSISTSYWDTQTSGMATSKGGSGVVGKTTTEMKTQSTYSGWDFGSIWAIDATGTINNGYPYLQWQSLLSNNSSPSTPTSLGGSSLVNGSSSASRQPSFSFNLADSDASDTVKFQIQIDTHSNFSAPVVDYTSALGSQGAFSFTVGQAAGSGSYTTGASSQTLDDGLYYWRVKAVDNNNSGSGFATANSGSVAFGVDNAAPSVPGTPTTTNPNSNVRPTWTWTASTDAVSGLAATPYSVNWCSNSSFTGCDANVATAVSNSYTLSTDLADGSWYFRVKSSDNMGYVSDYSSFGSVVIDATAPTISSLSPTSNSDTSELISWTTGELGSTQVSYGLTSGLGVTTTETDTGTRVNSHSVGISGLVACTTYYYRATSRDAAGNSGSSSVGTFTTSGCTGSASVVSQTDSSGTISTATGGTVSLTNSGEVVSLSIPVNYATSAANFQIKQLEKSTVLATTSTPTGYNTVGNQVYEFKSLQTVATSSSVFSQPLTVTMTYTSASVGSFDESSLWIYRWDGSSWNALSDCVVDMSGKTVTCTTTHFSTFSLFGRETGVIEQIVGSSSSSVVSAVTSVSGVSTPVCTDSAPAGVPNLFQVNSDDESVTVSFVTVSGVNRYQIFYGRGENADEYSDSFNYSGAEWIISRKIGGLAPGVKYYFKIRAANGCNSGSFSKVMVAETKNVGGITYIADEEPAALVEKTIEETAKKVSEIPVVNQLVEKKIEVKSMEIKPKLDIISYIVGAKETLWSIAQKLLGRGEEYTRLIADNVAEYPELIKSRVVSMGMVLKLDRTEKVKKVEKMENIENSEEDKKKYDLDVRVLADAGTPLRGVKVTLHSTPRTEITNDEGIAHFSEVEEGKHQVILAYEGYSGGGQTVSLNGDNKNLELVMQIKLTDGFNSPKVMMVVGALVGVILLLVGVIVWQKKSNK